MNDAVVDARTRAAVAAGQAVTTLSRALRRGEGTVIGGRVTLALRPRALEVLAASHPVVLVSGTNGKSTTTALLSAALTPLRPVTNEGGANLPGGLVTALAGTAAGVPAVLEVDEAYVARVVSATIPRVVTALNLTRDQMDRTHEVRSLAASWRQALPGAGHVVANADDPLVAWAAGRATSVTWVAAGQPWRADAVGCPACEGAVRFDAEGWSCTCGFARPRPDVTIEGDTVVRAGTRVPLRLALPGRANRANAAMALAAATLFGIEASEAVHALRQVHAVDGRYADIPVNGHRTRLLLAKNPAGWLEVLDLLDETSGPVVIAINSRIPDGRDVSWLWDVPFERLAGRAVAASGERWRDLSVRLRYGGVEHADVPEPLAAIRSFGGAHVDVAANYSAFRRLRDPQGV